MNKKEGKGIKVAIVFAVLLLTIVVAFDLVANYVPLDNIFSKTVNNITSKEVTVTDKGIADAVEKLYDATVIVEVGSSSSKLTGWGSGFVYKKDKKDAYILTNHHVVESSKYIEIVFSDESSVEGTLVGSDKYNDVAIVKVPASSVKAVAEIGKSEDVRVGDTVFAIGTPVKIDYKFTVTRGILSGKNRLCSMSDTPSSQGSYWGYYQTQDTETWYISLLQIDASINSGNSGGPLANSNGEVIGITNSKLSSSYGSSASIENMGFAIPVEDALVIAKELEEKGKVERPLLGVSTTTIENAIDSGVNVDKKIEKGAVVMEVQDDSVAKAAGIQKGDVIVKIGDYKIDDFKYLKYYLYRYRVGDTIDIVVNRNGKEKVLKAKLK